MTLVSEERKKTKHISFYGSPGIPSWEGIWLMYKTDAHRRGRGEAQTNTQRILCLSCLVFPSNVSFMSLVHPLSLGLLKSTPDWPQVFSRLQSILKVAARRGLFYSPLVLRRLHLDLEFPKLGGEGPATPIPPHTLPVCRNALSSAFFLLSLKGK